MRLIVCCSRPFVFRSIVRHLLTLLLTRLFFAASFFSVLAETVSAANITIVYPASGTPNELLAAKEVRRYVYLRSGQLLRLKPVASLPASGDLIVVAANGSPLLAPLHHAIGYEASEGQTLLKSVAVDGRNTLVVSGADADSTLMAAYRYAERIGIGFDLAGDAIPDAQVELSLSGFDEVGRPLFETRGILPFHDFFQGPDLWNTRDYKSVISQLPKLGMNFIGLKTYPRYSAYEERVREFGPTGPELTVWIGLPEDVHPDGNVKWSYHELGKSRRKMHCIDLCSRHRKRCKTDAAHA